MKYQTVNLVSLVTEAVEQQRLVSERHELILRMSEPEMLVDCDPVLIHRALSNLLDNAVKYSPEGGEVVVLASRQRDKALVAVADRGVGISRDELGSIFDRFYRASTAHRVCTEGLGLGLYIARQVLVLHGGWLWAESVEGEGSTFYFTLPVRASRLC